MLYVSPQYGVVVTTHLDGGQHYLLDHFFNVSKDKTRGDAPGTAGISLKNRDIAHTVAAFIDKATVIKIQSEMFNRNDLKMLLRAIAERKEDDVRLPIDNQRTSTALAALAALLRVALQLQPEQSPMAIVLGAEGAAGAPFVKCEVDNIFQAKSKVGSDGEAIAVYVATVRLWGATNLGFRRVNFPQVPLGACQIAQWVPLQRGGEKLFDFTKPLPPGSLVLPVAGSGAFSGASSGGAAVLGGGEEESAAAAAGFVTPGGKSKRGERSMGTPNSSSPESKSARPNNPDSPLEL